MDDFLHNLRSGKLKQGDRSNRSYNDPQYKGGPRRNTMDRRKGHYDNKESFERLNAIKEVLENLTESQKRMAEAYKARTQAEERKAKAMETIAKSLYQMANPNANDVDTLFAAEPAQTLDFRPEMIDTGSETSPDEIRQITEQEFDEETSEGLSDSDSEEIEEDQDEDSRTSKLTEVDRQALYTIIGQLRDEGEGWEKIARHIAAQGYPTASGKGSWRGVMVKTLYEKLSE